MTLKVQKLVQQATGTRLPDDLCRPPRTFLAEQVRYAKIHTKRADAGRWAAEEKACVTRHIDDLLPSQLVAADVMHFNVSFRRPGGSDCTPKLIAWADPATNRMYGTIVVVALHEGIRQEHTVGSFTAMAADRAFGLPRHIYADNGPEYGWLDLIEPLAELEVCVTLRGRGRRRPAVLRSLPYTPQSKAIESLFAAFQATVEPLVPGFFGSWTEKKVERQGRAPKPFPGGEEACTAALQTAIRLWNAKPQQGRLAGLSPDQAHARFVANGRARARVLNPRHADFHLSRREIKTVRKSGLVSVDGRAWGSDELLLRRGEKIEVRVPFARSPDWLYAVVDGRTILLAPDVLRGMLDPAGAGESARRKAEQNRQMRALEADVDPIDKLAYLQELDAELPEPVDPPEPAAIIGIDPRLDQQADEIERARARPKPLMTKATMKRLADQGFDDLAASINRKAG